MEYGKESEYKKIKIYCKKKRIHFVVILKEIRYNDFRNREFGFFGRKNKREGRCEMLNIFYGNMPEAIFNTAVYFKNTYEDAWITDPMAKEMILDVDKSVVLDGAVIDSPVLGKIAPISLSGGVKTLILMKNEHEKVFNASACGDNCAKWILKLAEKQELTINLRHLMDFGEGTFDIRILNTNQIVHSMRELVPIAGLYV